LLDKAAATNYEAEGQAYVQKAQELMLRYAVDEATLAKRSGAGQPTDAVVAEKWSMSALRADAALLNAVVTSAGCRFIRHRQRDGALQGTVIGFPADILFSRSLYAALIMQRESALATTPRPNLESTRSFNHAFRTAFAMRIWYRLHEGNTQATASVPGAELVVRDKAQSVKDKLGEMFPNHRPGRPIRAPSGAGRFAGVEAANRASISGGRNEMGYDRPALGGGIGL
jgi:hypothetical protein